MIINVPTEQFGKMKGNWEWSQLKITMCMKHSGVMSMEGGIGFWKKWYNLTFIPFNFPFAI